MARYLREDGTKTNKDDPNRLVWFAVGCTFWTDDWNTLNTRRIPCCPFCSSVGMQMEAGKWFQSIREYDESHPGYFALFAAVKQMCIDQSVIRNFVSESERLMRNTSKGEATAD